MRGSLSIRRLDTIWYTTAEGALERVIVLLAVSEDSPA